MKIRFVSICSGAHTTKNPDFKSFYLVFNFTETITATWIACKIYLKLSKQIKKKSYTMLVHINIHIVTVQVNNIVIVYQWRGRKLRFRPDLSNYVICIRFWQDIFRLQLFNPDRPSFFLFVCFHFVILFKNYLK